MAFKFVKGTYKFHDEPNFNYQINRWVSFGDLPVEDVKCAAGRIKDLNDWKREFMALADKAGISGDVHKQAIYYRAVDFFLPYSDPQKLTIYNKLVGLLRESYKEYFENGSIIEKEVDYDGIKLPVYCVPNLNKMASKGTIVLTGGFDCYKEELIPVMIYFAQKGFDFYYFEGPGQGEVLQKYRYPMTYQWELPVKAVLDALGLNGITLIGLSLGGYLAPRAAVNEPRIKRVIAWGTMYDFYKVVSSRRGLGLELFINVMTALRMSTVFNFIVGMKMKKDAYTYWGIDHGMHVMGVNSPYKYFRKLRLFNTKKISHEIKQDFLLLAGSQDHFCDIKHFYKQSEKLTNVRTFTGRIFTASEHAENHCQFGNLQLVLDVMIRWIEGI
ncbi:alpha/beta hydrolase [Acetivibrio cellulolyticus]|uniref:alpha/beta hydrolase n=1 Tax=Acetivibrio cellulolyticus TaxID=35830 RepID=UPI0001E2BD63|nr:alpha/beta hydrolase [Acetivibrio cellulolyticus]